MWASVVDQRRPVRPDGAQGHGIVLDRGAQRRSRHLVPADDPHLLVERRAIPRLDAHPDPPGDEIGAAAHPRLVGVGAGPDEGVHVRGVLREQVVRAVLEAHEVARSRLGGARGGCPTEAQLEPSDDGDATGQPGEVAHRVERDLWVVGAGLDREVAAAPAGLQRIAGERGDLGEGGRAPTGEAEPAIEESRPESHRDRETSRMEAEGLPRVDRRGERGARDVAHGCCPCHQPRGRGPGAQELLELGIGWWSSGRTMRRRGDPGRASRYRPGGRRRTGTSPVRWPRRRSSRGRRGVSPPRTRRTPRGPPRR